MVDPGCVGRLVDEVEFPVEEGKLRELAVAIGDAPDGSVPLTFSAVASHWRDQAAMVAALGLELGRVVVGSTEWEYHAPVAVGDRLRARRVVTEVETKPGRGGPMTLITLQTEVRRDDGELALVQRDVVIELAP